MSSFDYFVGRRPWVNGDKFIGPSIKNLILAYYIAQGEPLIRAQEFADAHLDALRKEYSG